MLIISVCQHIMLFYDIEKYHLFHLSVDYVIHFQINASHRKDLAIIDIVFLNEESGKIDSEASHRCVDEY